MQVTHIDGLQARCEARGIERDVSLFLLQHELPAPGDFVLVHVGYALQRVTQQDAYSTWELLDQVLESDA